MEKNKTNENVSLVDECSFLMQMSKHCLFLKIMDFLTHKVVQIKGRILPPAGPPRRATCPLTNQTKNRQTTTTTSH